MLELQFCRIWQDREKALWQMRHTDPICTRNFNNARPQISPSFIILKIPNPTQYTSAPIYDACSHIKVLVYRHWHPDNERYAPQPMFRLTTMLLLKLLNKRYVCDFHLPMGVNHMVPVQRGSCLFRKSLGSSNVDSVPCHISMVPPLNVMWTVNLRAKLKVMLKAIYQNIQAI